MLVMALVRGNEGKVREMTAGQVGIQAAETFNVLQAVLRVAAGLDVGEVCEGIVLDRVEVRHARRCLSQVGEESVAVIDTVSAGGGQVLLITLPAHAGFNKLVPNADADCLCGSNGGVVDRLGGCAFVGRI